LIHERYSEIDKAEDAGKVSELIEKFAQRFADKRKLQRVIGLYSRLLEVDPLIVDNPDPRVTETDKMALFGLEEDTFTLYLQKTGKWGFHM
jgi:hypothetical protein